MRTFVPIRLNPQWLTGELDELEEFLGQPRTERREIAPFFKSRANLCASLALLNGAVEAPDRWASELDLFGDFICDVACGDSEANAYTLVEFEDAQRFKIFRKLPRGRTIKRWSGHFERGFSQVVDWAWRLSTEPPRSEGMERVFGSAQPTVHLLLLIGRDSDLTAADLARLKWRANHVTLGTYRMSCFTFDGALQSIRRRLMFATQQS